MDSLVNIKNISNDKYNKISTLYEILKNLSLNELVNIILFIRALNSIHVMVPITISEIIIINEYLYMAINKDNNTKEVNILFFNSELI